LPTPDRGWIKKKGVGVISKVRWLRAKERVSSREDVKI
jgi:hypothetical protein